MKSTRLISGLVLLLLLVVVAVGLPALTVDPHAISGLPSEHPVATATRLLDSATAGDDVLVVVARSTNDSPHGVLEPAALEVLESVLGAMEALPEFESVRSVTNAPILSEVDGAVTAITPLRPPPTSIEAWAEARGLVLQSPFVRGNVLSEDGRVAALVGWLWSGDGEASLVRGATFALKDESFRSGELGAQIQGLVNEARLAVALGDAEGPVDREIARRLNEAAGSNAELAGSLDEWRSIADPALRAAAALGAELDRQRDAAEAAGLRLGLVGQVVMEQEAPPLFMASVTRALLALSLLAGFIAFTLRRSVLILLGAAACAPLVFAGPLGISGVLDLPVHPYLVTTAILAAWWAVAWGVGRAEGAADDLSGLFVWAAPAGVAAAQGLGLGAGAMAGLSGLLVAALAAVALFGARTAPVEPLDPQRRSRMLLLAVVLMFVGAVLLFPKGLGFDPSRFLVKSHEAGWAARVLARDLGTLPPAYLVADRRGGEARSFASTAEVAGLRVAEEGLQRKRSVAGLVGWPEFVSSIHQLVAGAPAGSLPADDDAMNQYLLMFNRVEDTRVFVSTDLEVAASLVRSFDGRASLLAAHADRLTDDPSGPQLAGDALGMMMSARDQVRRSSQGLILLLVLLFVVPPLPRSSAGGGRTGHRALSTLACLALSLGVASVLEAAITPSALLGSLTAAGLVAATWSWSDRAALTSLGLAAAAACGLLPSAVTSLRALGLLLLVACVTGWILRAMVVATGSPPSQQSTPGPTPGEA